MCWCGKPKREAGRTSLHHPGHHPREEQGPVPVTDKITSNDQPPQSPGLPSQCTMTTSMHIRGGLILWREELESSSRREPPPPPDPRMPPLAPIRHAGDIGYCHVDGGVILRGGGRPQALKQARESSDTGAVRDVLRPFSSTAITASPSGISFEDEEREPRGGLGRGGEAGGGCRPLRRPIRGRCLLCLLWC